MDLLPGLDRHNKPCIVFFFLNGGQELVSFLQLENLAACQNRVVLMGGKREWKLLDRDGL